MPDIDVSLDYLLFDWTESIAYYSRIDENTLTNALAVIALKRENNKTYDVGMDGEEVAMHTATWEVWRASMPINFIPKRGDEFGANGVSGAKMWIVDAVDYCDYTSRYRLMCHQEGFNS